MTIHHLKTWPEFFQAVRSGAKTFEARKDDRGFQVGDTLVLEEYEPDGLGRHTGEQETRVVTYILRGHGSLTPNFCILGFSSAARLVAAETVHQGTISPAPEKP